MTYYTHAHCPVQWFDSLESTNSTAQQYILQGEHGPQWIVARHQTKGRGRWAHQWQSLEGNFHGSFFYEPPRHAAPFRGYLFILGALALLSSLRSLCPNPARKNLLHLKWPNDVGYISTQDNVQDNKQDNKRLLKIAGILVECLRSSVIVGFGVNLVHIPQYNEAFSQKPGSFKDLSEYDITPSDLLSVLHMRWGMFLQKFEKNPTCENLVLTFKRYLINPEAMPLNALHRLEGECQIL